METSATLKHARISAQKARLVADQIRGMEVDKAIDLLDFSVKRAAKMIRKLLLSAAANAENNLGMMLDDLKVHRIFVDEATSLKRIRPRARGRANRILKPTSHITIVIAHL
jgi:large subunit ribosomal protein L22